MVEASKFLQTLLTKIIKDQVRMQREAYHADDTDQENILRMSQSLVVFERYVGAKIYDVLHAFDVPIDLTQEIDESILTVANLNDCIAELIEREFGREEKALYIAGLVLSLYKELFPAAPPISPGDSIMTHIASSDALYDNVVSMDKSSLVTHRPEGINISFSESEQDIVDQYINLFNGEEYHHDRKNHSEGDAE